MCDSLEDAEGAPLLRFRVSSTEVGTVRDIHCVDNLRVKNFRLNFFLGGGFHLRIYSDEYVLVSTCARRGALLYTLYVSL